MKSSAPLLKTLLPPIPELGLEVHVGTPGYGEDGLPSEEQAAAAEQAIADQLSVNPACPNARYTGGNVYDFINAQTTL